MIALSTSHDAADGIRWNAIWNLLVLAVLAVLLLPLGRWGLLWELTRAYAVLWGVLLCAAALVPLVQRAFRVVDDPPSDAYVFSNAAVGVVLLTIWAGYTALLIRQAAGGAPPWVAAILYPAGLLASHAAFSDVSAIYGGSIYRVINACVALGGFLFFAAWPAAARALFGWLA